MSKMITQIKNQNVIRCRAIYYIKNDIINFIIDVILSISNLNFPHRNPFPTKTKELLNVLLFI